MTSAWVTDLSMSNFSARLVPLDISALLPWQYRIGDLVLGEKTPYTISKIDGLDLPASRPQFSPRSGRSGDWRGRPFENSRTVTLTLQLFGDTYADIVDALEALYAACAPQEYLIPFVYWNPPRGPRLLIVEPTKCSNPLDRNAAYGFITVMVELRSPDPLRYDAMLKTASTGVYTSGGGHIFPVKFSHTFPGAVSAGVITAVNAGNAPTAPVVRFHGPLIDPVLENISTGERIAITMTIDAGAYIDVDLSEHTVVWNGISSVRGVVDASSVWWSLNPGDNQVRFLSRGGSSAAIADLSWRDAWY